MASSRGTFIALSTGEAVTGQTAAAADQVAGQTAHVTRGAVVDRAVRLGHNVPAGQAIKTTPAAGETVEHVHGGPAAGED